MCSMIRGGFLNPDQRRDLTALARKGKVEHRVARRANALILLDRGMSCEEVAAVLLLDDDTVRTWHGQFERTGVKGVSDFNGGGSLAQLTEAQMAELRVWVAATLPRSTREIGAWIEQTFGVVYETRSGLIKLMNRLDLVHRKPQTISRKLSPAKQEAFIAAYEALLNTLEADEAVLFIDAVHPTHGVRPVGCWAPKEDKIAVEQASGRDRLDIHGAVDLETGQTPHDRRADGRCRQHHRPAGRHRGHVSDDAAHPRLSRQRPPSPRQAGAGMARSAGPAYQAAFRPRLLPASQSHRAIMGRHAQGRHPQPNLSDLSQLL